MEAATIWAEPRLLSHPAGTHASHSRRYAEQGVKVCCRMRTTRQSTLCAIMGRVLDISDRYLPIVGSENPRYGCARADGGASVPLLATQSVAAFKLFRNAAIRERSCSMDG